ncbi:dipeptidyl peptidase III [Nemania sp. FL0031]|nr:dipeptidyl peptidase III [Nemania sp. FL0031]
MSAARNVKGDETTHRLELRAVFDNLVVEEKVDGERHSTLYAHHLARACWYGSRILLRQCSPESEGIFEFILELHKSCGGSWDRFLGLGITQIDLDTWLSFAGMFLSSLGNYFGDGDHKVIPDISENTLRNMAKISPEASAKLERIVTPMMSTQPSSLGYPSEMCQSGYYPGDGKITEEEIAAVSNMMQAKKMAPENTRLLKRTVCRIPEKYSFDVFEILQASADKDPETRFLGDISVGAERPAKVFLRRGDHSTEMTKICDELTGALQHAATNAQRTTISQLINSFRTGDYKAFCDAHKIWVTDKSPQVEHCIGFLFGYRDPHGIRGEWHAVAGIARPEETGKIRRVVEMSTEIIRTLPWAVPDENNGKGPFEPSELDAPDFEVIHVLAFASSTVWEATNITSDDEGKRYGVKSIVYGNRMNLNAAASRPCFYVDSSESQEYVICYPIVRFVGTVIHEIIGHGAGKLLVETSPGEFNFDHLHPPVSPLTGESIKTWYKPGETWSSVFGKLAMTAEECRAFLAASYLADNKDVLNLFGYNDTSTPTADDYIYNSYLRIGVEGLCALRSFNAKNQVWGGDHDRANFTIFKHLLRDGGGFMWIEHDVDAGTLFVRIDRSKIYSHGKPSIGKMFCKMNIWRSTADIEACRPYYEELSIVDGKYEQWRQIVVSNPEPKWKFVQPNTFIRNDGTVELREYEASNVGIIQSFFERNI